MKVRARYIFPWHLACIYGSFLEIPGYRNKGMENFEGSPIKKGSRKDPVNYRPISLLSSLSKVLEKLLYQRMMAFCTTNELLTPVQ